MNYHVLLATADAVLETELRDLLIESGDFTVAAVAGDTTELMTEAGHRELDVVLLHESLGPAPSITTIRDLVARQPAAAIVLVTRETGADVLASALEAGARGVVSTPVSFADVQGRITAAAAWGHRVRQWTRNERDEIATGVSGRVVAVAGARGGVGATTIATQLALRALKTENARVCLVDLDLQAGDVAGQLGIPAGHSVVELVDIADELTRYNLEETLYRHPCGLRVLPAPIEGERAEIVSSAAVRSTLAVLRTMFDQVVVDCGSTVTDGNLGAVEVADQVLVVAAPDVLTLRAVRRLIEIWDRLQARQADGINAVLNLTSRNRTVQPAMAARVLPIPLCAESIPARFGELEPLVNTGRLDALDDKKLLKAFGRLAIEAGLVEKARPRSGRRERAAVADKTAVDKASGRRRVLRSEAGAQHLEFAVLAPLLVVSVLMVLQAVFCGVNLLVAQHSAATAAERLTVGLDATETVTRLRTDLPQGWTATSIRIDATTVSVTLRPPALLPGLTDKLEGTGHAIR